MATPSRADKLTAARMLRLRQRLGFKKLSDFAVYLDVSKQRWANFEYGYAVSRDIAKILKQKVPGIDYDWIWDGETAGLSDEAAAMLGETKEKKKKQKAPPPRIPDPLAALLRASKK